MTEIQNTQQQSNFIKLETSHKGIIIGVGTELTTGQITNKNGSWISHSISKFGIETAAHIVIPDERTLILNAFHMAALQSDYIFITGGLGPTSDDFTRELVSEFTQKKLIFDEKSWGHIQVRLTTRGFTVKEIQKQQCYFPEGAQILENSHGTAHGFYMTHNYHGQIKHLFILPGPPREIEAIWKDHIQSLLQKLTTQLTKKKTLSWDTLGVGESDVALLVEAEVTRFLDITPRIQKSMFEIGYRVHLPYVEVKLTFNEKEETHIKPLIHALDTQLNKITVLKNFDDMINHIIPLIKETDFVFYDFLTGGYLHNRLSSQMKNIKNWTFRQSQMPIDVDVFQDEDQFLALFPYDENDINCEKALLLASYNDKKISLVIEAPMKAPLMLDRRKQYFAEMAIIEFVRRIKT